MSDCFLAFAQGWTRLCHAGRSRAYEGLMSDEPELGRTGPPIAIAELRDRAFAALSRARFMVQAVSIPGHPGRYTITEGDAPPELGLAREAADRYADAINNEAALARALLLLIAELEHHRPHEPEQEAIEAS
jgi:hypothetical protein